MNRFSLLLLIPVVIVVSLAGRSIAAAQDPFGDAAGDVFGDFPGSDDFPAAAPVDSSAGDSQADQTDETIKPDRVVTQLMETPGRDVNTLARSISILARLKAWTQLDQLLKDAAARGFDQADQAAMAAEIGPSLRLRIGSQSAISDESRQFLSEIAEADSARRQDKQVIADSMDALSAGSVDARLAAMRTLLAGGDAAIAALVGRIVSDIGADERTQLLRVLLRLGDGGPSALEQLALYGAIPERERALNSLRRIDANRYINDLLSAYFASDATDQERSIAASALTRVIGEVPTRESAITLLFKDLQDRLADAHRMTDSASTVSLWSVDTKRQGVESTRTFAVVAAYRRAYDAAARLRRLGPLPTPVNNEVLTADLSYRVLTNPDWGSPEDRNQFTGGNSIDPVQLSAALDAALQRSNQLAALGWLRLIDANVSPRDAAQLLRGPGAEPTPLVRAAGGSDPRVRYEAVAAISRLGTDQSYPGISRVQRTIDEMRQLGDLPTVLLVETRSDVIQRLEMLLSQLGYRVKVVASARELERELARGGDLRMIVAKTQLSDYAPIELLDRVRRSPLGRDIPIMFYGEESRFLGAERWDGLTVQFDEPMTTAGFAPLLDDVERRSRLTGMSGAERRMFRDLAQSLD